MKIATPSKATYIGQSLTLRCAVVLFLALSLLVLPAQTAVRYQPLPPQLLSRIGSSSSKQIENYSKLPLSFEPNLGQAEGSTKFIAHSGKGDIQLKSNEVVLNIPAVQKQRATASSEMLARYGKEANLDRENQSQHLEPGSSMRMVLKNGHARRTIGTGEQFGTVSYFLGKNPKNWHAGIPTYSRVKYENVYPGIDQVFYGNGEELEYDFVVSAGAHPDSIRLAFRGQSYINVEGSGDLILRTADSQEIKLHRPFAYQEINGQRQSVSVRYLLTRSDEVSLEVGRYDKTKRLIIDPVLSFSTYLGGSGNEAGFDVAVDGNGSTYVTGSTDSSQFSSLGGSNAFIAKLSPDGTQRVYLAVIGGTGDDTGFSVAVDTTGAAYITGATDSTDFPVVGSFQSTFGGGSQDAFIAKLSPDGSNFVYASYFGGSGNDAGFAIAVDSQGSAYVTGSTDSSELSTLGRTDVFVTKLNPAGNTRVYSSILGGSGDDTGFDIAVDGQGSAYVVGSTDSADLKTTNALQPNFGGAQDAFVAKLSNDGATQLYSTYVGGSGNDLGFGVAVDNSGNAYITGSTDSPEYTALGGRDVFVTKLDATGDQRSYFTILGGSGDDAGFGIVVDGNGNAYVTGSTDSSNFTTANALQATQGGAQDAFVAKLSPAGSTLDYSTFVGRSGNEAGFSITVDSAGGAFVTGFTTSPDFPLVSPLQGAGGGGDVFVLKFATATGSSPVLQLSSSAFAVNEGGGTMNIAVTRTGDTSGAATVGYATSNGTAREGRDYVASVGTLSFAAGETTKSFSVLIIDNAFVDGTRTVNLTLSNPTGAALSLNTGVLNINDNDSVVGTNPIDIPRSFVQFDYYDFFGRPPDQSGWDFWTNEITSCGTNSGCIEGKRINVSAAFFLSIEFQQTGYLVERIYKVAYGDASGASTLGGAHNLPVPSIRFSEFLPDTQAIGRGVVVLQPGWEQQLENNKSAFMTEFVQRPRFTAAFPSTLNADQFVDRLITNAGNPLSASERNQLVNDLANGSKTRAQVLRAIAENQVLSKAEFNRAFVLMQYFGYLRRDPNSVNDSDYTGYDFWLNKLNQFNGNYIDAEMVKAFISSAEYRQRFGP